MGGLTRVIDGGLEAEMDTARHSVWIAGFEDPNRRIWPVCTRCRAESSLIWGTSVVIEGDDVGT